VLDRGELLSREGGRVAERRELDPARLQKLSELLQHAPLSDAGGNLERPRTPFHKSAVGRVLERRELLDALAAERRAGRRIVFTNGCFDLLHAGHVRTLAAARALGDVLVVAVNSDESVRRLGKGPDRPLFPARERAEVVAALAAVDYVTIFPEDTPLELVRAIVPDVLAKGGDWRPEAIVGAEIVARAGGRVVSLPYHPGLSTTEVLRRIRAAGREEPD
jgi:D-beta-D-heptose 7-phosphate kinase/D-beta-D-heptose 1-phosphate adenosyltransferase